MTGWTTVLAASAVCFATKAVGYLVPAGWLERPRVMRVANSITIAMLAALVAVQTLGSAGGPVIDARVAAVAVAVVALILRAPFIVVVALAAAVAAALRALG